MTIVESPIHWRKDLNWILLLRLDIWFWCNYKLVSDSAEKRGQKMKYCGWIVMELTYFDGLPSMVVGWIFSFYLLLLILLHLLLLGMEIVGFDFIYLPFWTLKSYFKLLFSSCQLTFFSVCMKCGIWSPNFRKFF